MCLKQIDKALFKKLHILYVEDDFNTREEISFFLKMVVGKLTTAQNGQEGLGLFHKDQFDMIITDIQMPVMNGLDMVKAIRETDKDVPIAVTTAFSDTDFLIRAIECGVDKYIIKPIDIAEMAMVIQKCTNYANMAQKIKAYDTYSKFLLDQNTSFMFITHNGKCEYANKQLQSIINIQSSEAIYHSTLIFINENEEHQHQNWIQYVQNNPKAEHLVRFQNSKTHYQLSCKHFENIEKTVFLFREISPNTMKNLLQESVSV